MVRSGADDDSAFIAGDGDYAIEVVSESRHQERLEWLGQGRGEEPVDYACTALLVYEPDNPYAEDAVSVSINGVRVGYLPPDAATSMIAAMQTWDFDHATCDAIIESGWYRSADDKGDFCVRLDVNPSFAPAALPVAHPVVHRPSAALAPVSHATRPRSTAYDLVLGAAATVAMLAFVGIVWLFVQRSTDAVTEERQTFASSVRESAPAQRGPAGSASERSTRRLRGVAAPPSGDGLQETGAANAAPAAAPQGVNVALAEADQPSPVPAPSEPSRPDTRVAAAQAAADASTLPAPQAMKAMAPVTRGASRDAPENVSSASVAEARHAPLPAGAGITRPPLVAAMAPPAAEEIHPLLNVSPIVTTTRAEAEEIDTSATAATSPPGVKPVPQRAAHSALPANAAPGTEWATVIPPPRPAVDDEETEEDADADAVATARAEAKARAEAEARAQTQAKARAAAEARRARARARARLQAARARARARNRTRYGRGSRDRRRERRVERDRRASNPAASSRPPTRQRPAAAAQPTPPGSKLFEAWRKDVQSAMEAHQRRLQR